MRHLFMIACFSIGCMGTSSGPGGDDMQPDAGSVERTCPMPTTSADLGGLAATKAEMCNVSGSMGQAHWYKLAAAMPGTMDYVQIELWDNTGVFAGGLVHTGTFTITGNEATFAKCGVCVRGLGAKGTPQQKEYFATGGTVNVTAVGGNGQPISATLSDISFVEIDATTHNLVANGCTASLGAAKIDGTVTQLGGSGGGTSGGGGTGTGACPLGIAD
jgi:hypothetical protein